MRDLLEQEIIDEIDGISTKKFNDDEYTIGVNGVAKLLDAHEKLGKLEVEECKIQLEKDKQEMAHEIELAKIEMQAQTNELEKAKLEITEKQNSTQKKIGYAQIGATLLVAAVGVAVKVWGTKKTMDYDENGVIPTNEASKFWIRDLFK